MDARTVVNYTPSSWPDSCLHVYYYLAFQVFLYRPPLANSDLNKSYANLTVESLAVVNYTPSSWPGSRYFVCYLIDTPQTSHTPQSRCDTSRQVMLIEPWWWLINFHHLGLIACSYTATACLCPVVPLSCTHSIVTGSAWCTLVILVSTCTMTPKFKRLLMIFIIVRWSEVKWGEVRYIKYVWVALTNHCHVRLKSAHHLLLYCFLDHPLSVHVSTIITSPHTHKLISTQVIPNQ